MIDNALRAPYQHFIIAPLLRYKRVHTLSPSAITLCGAALGILIPLLLYLHAPLCALTFLILSGFCDTLDGPLARHQGRATPKGAVLDIVSDRWVEFSILLGLFLYQPDSRGLTTILMLGAVFLCVTTFLVVGIFETNESEKGFHYSPGIIERAEAFIFFSLMILLPPLFTPLALLFTLLTLLTALLRVSQFINK